MPIIFARSIATAFAFVGTKIVLAVVAIHFFFFCSLYFCIQRCLFMLVSGPMDLEVLFGLIFILSFVVGIFILSLNKMLDFQFKGFTA